MNVKGLAIAMGIGAAVGAVGILTLSHSNPARKLVSKVANKVENATDKVMNKMMPQSME